MPIAARATLLVVSERETKMQPVLFSLGGVEFPSYLTMMMIGFIAAIYMARRRGEAAGLDGVAIVDLGIWMLVLGVAGARLLAVFTDGHFMDFVHLCTDPTLVDPIDTAVQYCTENSECGHDYLCNLDARDAVVAGEQRSMCYPPRDCLATFKFWQGGLTFYGGPLLAIPFGMWFSKRRGLGAWRMADIAAPSLMLGLAVGRIGCFLNGCCYGGKSEGAFAVTFPGKIDPRHPVQLYESLSVFAITLLLLFIVDKRAKREGQVFGGMLLLYGLLRPVMELFRDDERGGLGPLSTSQLISIPIVVLGVFLILRAAPPRKREES